MIRKAIAMLLACLVSVPVLADVRGFPTAEGQGRPTTGGRDASAIVIQITTLTESTSKYCAPGATNGGTQANNWEDASSCTSDANCGSESGACVSGALGGLFRAFKSQAERYIVPRVSGELDLSVISGGTLTITSGNFTYLGHLAPSKAGTARGIYLTGGDMEMSGDAADDWIIRYFAVHAASGDLNHFTGQDCDGIDAFRVQSGGDAEAGTSWIIDHAFFTGSGDENLEINRASDFTVQHSVNGWAAWLVGECDDDSLRFCLDDGDCPGSSCNKEKLACTALGSLAKFSNGSVVKNAWILNVYRNPKSSSTSDGDHVDYINNFTFGANDATWGTNEGISQGRACQLVFNSSSTCGWWNVIGNYVRNGPECQTATPAWMSFDTDGGCAGSGDTSSGRLYVNDNIHSMFGNDGLCSTANTQCTVDDDCPGAETCEKWAGICNDASGAVLKRNACRDDGDCGAGSCVTPACPESSPCGETKDGIFDYGSVTLESSAFSHNVTLWDSEDVDENLVDPATGNPNTMNGTRDAGPNYPVEGEMLKRILDYGHAGVGGDPWMCPTVCEARSSGDNFCPDGEFTSGSAVDVWRMGRSTTSHEEIDVHDCTSSAHPDFVADTYYMGVCDYNGTMVCNCEDGEAGTDGGSDGACGASTAVQRRRRKHDLQHPELCRQRRGRDRRRLGSDALR